jgi:hypothetical protein
MSLVKEIESKSMRTKADRSRLMEEFSKLTGVEINPELIAEHMIENEDEYPIEVSWIASNYKMALHLIEVYKIKEELDILIASKKV